MYELFVGPLLLQPDHLCHVRACASPAHIEDVTPAVNTARRLTKPLGNDAAAAANRRKTHCPRGHPHDGANTRRENRGRHKPSRKCRACDRIKKFNAREPARRQRPDVDLCCPSGHERTAETLRFNSRGHRICVLCCRAAVKRSAKKSRERLEK